ncbi:AMP-binding protein [Kordiimonas aestuarii]|uniref:AMP-binding protein n=1 Tax=Kordiimonas aestuarii TaxID=1005925 RepID=UPI0021D22E37|nr:AMP-binding protein [Kordiimonas aestuarii]
MMNNHTLSPMQPFSLTLDKFIEHAAKWHPDTEVVTGCEGTEPLRVGYSDISKRSKLLSGALHHLGLKAGDFLATLAWNSQDHLECWYGAMGAGIACHTLNPRLTVAHLAEMLSKSGSRVLAAGAGLLPLALEILEAYPALEHIILLDKADATPTTKGTSVKIWNYDNLIAAHGSMVAWGEIQETAPAGLCFTSGTTGSPKGVLYTHRSNYLHTLHLLQANGIGITSSDVVMPVVPMFHANGWGLPFAASAVGAKLVLPGRITGGKELAALIQEEEVSFAAGVPTVWLGLVDYLEKVGGSVPTLKRILVGGSPIPQALMERIETHLGVSVQTSWGMTELSPLGTIATPFSGGCVAEKSGRVTVGVDLLIADANGTPLPEQRNTEGHLYVKGASVLSRYFGESKPAVNDEGWFDTGDLAVIDDAGNLSITGRAKDLIKSGGEWINPVEIEAMLGGMSEIALAAVIGRVHPRWGERPILIVEEREGHTLQDQKLLEFLRRKLPNWWVPDEVVRLPKIPLAATGKIDKMRLRHDFGA